MITDDTPEDELRRMVGLFSRPKPLPAAPDVAPVATAPVSTPDQLPPVGVPFGPPKSEVDSRLGANQAELSRLQTTGSGVDQLRQKHPVLGTIAKIGDALLGATFPAISMGIPGTTMHHNALENRAEGRVAQDVGEQEKEAQTAALTSQANLAGVQAGIAGQGKFGTTPEEITIHDLMTGDNGHARINPQTHKPYEYLEAFAATKQAAQDVKPEPIAPAHVTYDAGIPVSVTGADKKTYDVNDPNLPPELKPLVDAANRAHGIHVKESKDVAAAGQAAIANRQEKTEDFQTTEKGREHITKIETDYTEAASKADLIRDAIRQAQNGNKMAAAFQGMLATLGITTMEGVKRVNAVELGIPTGAGSLWDKVQGKAGKWKAGQPMDADLQKDLSALADTIQQASYRKYMTQHAQIKKRYGLTDEEPVPGPGGLRSGEEKPSARRVIDLTQ